MGYWRKSFSVRAVELASQTTTTSDTTGAALLHGVQVPAESARFVQVANPWPNHIVCFEPSLELPLCVSSAPIVASGTAVCVTLHNHREEPVSLNTGHRVDTIKVAEVVGPQENAAGASPSNLGELVPGHLSPVQQHQLTHLLEQYRDIFSHSDEDIRQTPVLEHSIETQGPPVRLLYCQQNPTVQWEDAGQVQQMLERGIICHSNSPWASPVIMAWKKDCNLRLCVDFKKLNAATVKDKHPLLHIDDLLDAFHGTCWFSTPELKSSYWQVPIHEADKPKMAFWTRSGQLYGFNQGPFGLCNAPTTFSCLMDRILAGLNWEMCLFYLNDIIVFSKTWEDHLESLEGIFNACGKLNWSWVLRNAHWPPLRWVIWGTAWPGPVYFPTLHYWRPLGRSPHPRMSRK